VYKYYHHRRYDNGNTNWRGSELPGCNTSITVDPTSKILREGKHLCMGNLLLRGYPSSIFPYKRIPLFPSWFIPLEESFFFIKPRCTVCMPLSFTFSQKIITKTDTFTIKKLK
jgi:hypothetical protein